MTAERLVVSAVTVLSALDSRSCSPVRLACSYFSVLCNSQPELTSQIRVQIDHELFEQMHFFDDPFSSCSRRTTRFECRMNGVERRQYCGAGYPLKQIPLS